ncbi:MAG: hypothetical protein AAGB31_11255 [Bdellovibrio sp.]
MKSHVLFLTTILLLMSTQSFAFGQRPLNIDENPEQTLAVAPNAAQEAKVQEELQKLQTEMVSRFQQVESLLSQNRTSEALSGAKWILDTVRVKTGIDPKARLQEKFLIPTVFADQATSIESLPEAQRILVIKTVSQYRGGLYIDLINLSKRTTLLYIKALMAEMKSQGGFYEEDRNKIIADLAKATLIPMPLVDKNGKEMVVFEEDVANEDHVYMFNREIKKFLLSEKALSINEEIFVNYKNEMKSSLNPVGNYKSIDSCMKDASLLDSSYSYSRSFALKTCFYNNLEKFTSMSVCYSYAVKLDKDDVGFAKDKCFYKFNQ